MHTFRSTLAGLVALALSLSSSSCGDRDAGSKDGSAPDGQGASAQLVRIRLQLNWVPEPEFGGIYAAIQDGLYRDAGLEVEVIKGSAQVPSAQLVAQGACETAIVSGDEILTLRRKGGSLVGIFAIFQRNPTGFLVHEANPIRTLEELWRSDSTVALDPGLPFVKILDAKYGGERLRRVPSTGALATFLATPSFVQQCFISAEPVEVRLRGVDARVLGLEPVYNPYTAVIAAHGPWLAANRDAATRFVRATSEGWARYQRDPERYNPGIVAQNPAMSLEAMNIAAEIQRGLIDASPIGSMTAARWDELAQQLQSIGVIPDASVEGAFEDLFGSTPEHAPNP